MKTVSTLAFANAKYHKAKNILSGVAIFLTTLLIFLIISIGIGTEHAKNYVVNQTSPTWHGMYSGISEEKKDELIQHASVENYGLRQDLGEAKLEEGRVRPSYFDKQTIKMYQLECTSGVFPKKGNEAVLSKAGLKALGYEHPKLGDTITLSYQPYEGNGLGYETQASFSLTGFLKDQEGMEKAKDFRMLVSEEFMAQKISASKRSYDFTFQLAGAKAQTTDDTEEDISSIAEDFQISPENTMVNEAFLEANYTDPEFYMGMLALVAVMLIAGALAIYSIYYVSLISKVQEFGKLRALGATKHQMRQVVLRENLLVSLIAIPAGLLTGIITVRFFFKMVMGNSRSVSGFTRMESEAITAGKVQLIIPWVVLLVIGAVLLMVVFSSVKPMRMASKIMPVEAINYNGQSRSEKKARKGYLSLNLRKLAEANLSRNKKRTLVTILSLGVLGALFIGVSALFSCMRPYEATKQQIAGDFRLSTDSVWNDKMHPEQDWRVIQQHNPMSEKMLEKIRAIPGVKKVSAHQSIDVETSAVKGEEKPFEASFYGINEQQLKAVQKYIEKGKVSYRDLLSGDKIIVTGYLGAFNHNIKAGDKWNFTIFDGKRTYQKKMTVAAIGLLPDGVAGDCDLVTSNQAIRNMSKNNLTYTADIQSAKAQKKQVKASLEKIVSENKFLTLETFDHLYFLQKGGTQMVIDIGYGIMMILGIVGLLNLINTTVDSIFSRKRELSMMQAIGMSGRQMRRMLITESFSHILGILGIATGLGSAGGYALYLHAAKTGMMNIRDFYYPWKQVLLLILLVTAVQLVLTMVTAKLVNKESVIERLQTSE